jgi:regulator of protease activity HflC (stomatin/prohibitin superfamily)
MGKGKIIMRESQGKTISGLAMVVTLIILALVSISLFIFGAGNNSPLFIILGVIGNILWLFCTGGFFTLQPNEAAALVLFGDYKGTVKEAGWHWANPFLTKNRVSLRARNLNGERLKVNDEMGNPIEIAAVIVWRVENTVEALFDVNNYIDYVKIQSE